MNKTNIELEAEKYAENTIKQCIESNAYCDEGGLATGFKAGVTSEAAKEYWFKQFKKKYLTPENVNRVEVINHASVTEDCSVGRVFTHYEVKSCELSFQDSMKTLKIFI